MRDTLGTLVQRKRKVEKRVTNENKGFIINQINKHSDDFGYGKIPKTASIREVERLKKQYQERLTYDIVTIAVEQGNTIIAEIEGRDLKKSDDFQSKRLGEFAKQLATAKKQTGKKLTKDEKNFLERGNQNIDGFGNTDIITLFEKTKTKGQALKLIADIKSQDSKKVFYDKKLDIFDRVFQKVGIVREEDLLKIRERLVAMSFQEAHDKTNYLLKSLEMYGSEQPEVGSNDDETELANARLDDILIQLGEKKTGVKKTEKILNKYKTEIKEEE